LTPGREVLFMARDFALFGPESVTILTYRFSAPL
jgi:hypothetical protein